MLEKLPYHFRNESLLTAALTHRSVNHGVRDDDASEQDNQRLEFLGDTVLDLVISEFLFKCELKLKEGHMTHIRAGLVCEARLVDVAKALGLGAALIMDPGEEHGGGRRKNSILADAVEAILGAVFLDAGFPSARKLVLDLWSPWLADPDAWGDMLADHKSRLQEYAQGLALGGPRYELEHAEGPAHARLFTMSVSLSGHKAEASAYSKKEAEQRAAKELLIELTHNGNNEE